MPACSGEVNFISKKDNGLFAFKRFFRHKTVFITNIFGAVDDNKDGVGSFRSFGNLLLNRCFELVIGVFKSGGINQPELVVVILYFAKNVVASGSRFTGHNCLL
jgi:hypothetical protein